MKGPTMLNGAIPLLMVAFIGSNLLMQIEALSPEQTCPLVKNNTYIADPKNCSGWILCLNGKPISGNCTDNLVYDSANGECNYREDVSCTVDINSMCIGLTDVYKPHPNDCQSYCYCNNGETYTAKCPAGQYFNYETTSCIWADNSNCAANSPCFLAQNGFIKKPNTCTDWMRCGSGQVLSEGSCDPGLYYNPENGKCDYPQNVQCSSSPSDKPPSTSEPVAAADLCKEDKYFYADGQSCDGYFYCAKVNGEAKWGKCPKGSNLDVVEQECVDPEKVVCEEDRCIGSSNLFMAVAGTKCNEYYNCKNGVSTGTGKCPPGNPYFNEVAGVCQTAKLTYKICL